MMEKAELPQHFSRNGIVEVAREHGVDADLAVAAVGDVCRNFPTASVHEQAYQATAAIFALRKL